jgi:hypothetical protein
MDGALHAKGNLLAWAGAEWNYEASSLSNPVH